MFKDLKQTVYGKDFETPPGMSRIKVRRKTLPGEETAPQTLRRESNGLTRFMRQLPEAEGRIFDLGGLIDSNARYWAEKGVRVHAVDLLRAFDDERARMPHKRFDDLAAQRFVDRHLSFPEGMFDGILVWDVLHFLDSELLQRMVSRLTAIVRPDGVVLCFFHSQPKGEKVPVCRYAIEPAGGLRATVHCRRTIPTTFTNRNLETMLQDFKLTQFFLSRDSLREVIAVR